MPQKRSHWYVESRRLIARALDEGRAAGLDGKELDAHVRASYPFQDRLGFAYACWLAACREMLGGLRRGHGLNRVPPAGDAVDKYYWFRQLGAGKGPEWDDFLMKRREQLHLMGFPADDWDDAKVATWPAKEASRS